MTVPLPQNSSKSGNGNGKLERGYTFTAYNYAKIKEMLSIWKFLGRKSFVYFRGVGHPCTKIFYGSILGFQV